MVWLEHEENRGATRAVLKVAPLSVAGCCASGCSRAPRWC
ncbi:hypothetical protein I553_3259 [Mycobacterium xenopi 4042]|uniref:Uncharacterized protein n=1 Tax=Mycobacterium xenopi 4042 TaxID=1299334 RepID=X8E581_MYCXE|nr:hypothetical protein I552_0949 [Mycobacterium xenopi 3993]EUA75366.1 hypothetical protein I553_3259 [Mycobacterium xenopi 4042]